MVASTAFAEQQVAIISSLISEYVLDTGIADADDAKIVARRIYAAGFRMIGTDETLSTRLLNMEKRLSALEGWSGLSRHALLSEWEV